MSFQPDLRPPIQDMPPPGGFPSLDIKRTARARGPSGFQIWAFSSLAIMFGMYRVGLNNRNKAADKLEERKIRYAMAPVLQAEADKWYLERERQIMEKEAQVMKNVPGFKPGESPYYSDRWVPRQLAPLDRNFKK